MYSRQSRPLFMWAAVLAAAALLAGLAATGTHTLAWGATTPAPHSPRIVPAQETTCDSATNPAPTAVEVTQVPIVVDSTTDDYFVLYVQHDTGGETWEIPVLAKLGEAGATSLAENVEALPKERYRVEKYLVDDPADVDGDCLDDVTELNDLGAMNPVNPTGSVTPTDGAVALADKDTFDTIAGHITVRFLVVNPLGDRPGVYFINGDTHSSHHSFLEAVDVEASSIARGRLTHRAGPLPNGDIDVYSYWTIDSTDFSIAERTYTLLAANLPLLDDNLALHLPNADLAAVQAELPVYRSSRLNLLFDDDIHAEDFLPLNPGEGYGRLQRLQADERPHPRDVAIYETLPSELPRVAGIISTELQTPLSHVNLRAVQDSIPNAFIRDALDDSAVTSLLGSYVRYRVSQQGWSLEAATREEVEAHYASSRPASEQTPARDLSVTEITPLADIGFNDWDAFGVKAANLGVLRTMGFPQGTVPDGFAIPFYFYDTFMQDTPLGEEKVFGKSSAPDDEKFTLAADAKLIDAVLCDAGTTRSSRQTSTYRRRCSTTSATPSRTPRVPSGSSMP